MAITGEPEALGEAGEIPREGTPDADRLPWLETVDGDYGEGVPVMRILLLVLLALGVVAAVIFGVQALKRHQARDGGGALIAAQEGDYKVKPDDPGGTKVEGEGDTAIATSNGAGTSNASIDMSAAPEAPVPGHKGAPAPAATAGAKVVTQQIPDAKAAPARGALVQLGSFPDEAAANAAWGELSKKIALLAPLGKSVQAAQVGGRTVYRLRVNAGSAGQASATCAKVRAAGAACFVPPS